MDAVAIRRSVALGMLVAVGAVLLPGGATRAFGGDAPPAATIWIEEPAEGALVATRQVHVAGRIEGATADPAALLIVNGETVAVKDGKFEATVTAAADGDLTIRAVYGQVGVPATRAARSVVVDTEPPVLEMLAPLGASRSFRERVATVSVIATDLHLKDVTMNGRAVRRGEDGAYSAEFVLPAEGEVVVEVQAVDAAGNRSAVVTRHLKYLAAGVPEPDDVEAPGADTPLPIGSTAGGAFARRFDKRNFRTNGGNGTDVAVEDALHWLAAHQSADGSWEAEGFTRWCDGKPASGPGPDGRAKPMYDVGVTGLALLAFLGAGYTNRGEHPFPKVVNLGLRYLKNVQDPEGCFGARASGHFVYNHAIAALAMVEAYGMTGSALWKAPAQKALDFIAISRNPYFGWRYGVKPGENDTAVTGWMMMALKSAKLINASNMQAGKPASLLLDEDAFDGIRAWIDKMTDPDYGRLGYIQRGTGPARPAELVDKFPAEKSESMTAVGMLARIFLGEDPKQSDMIKKGAELCTKLVPSWNPNDGSIDMYYWYYATLAMFQVGGESWRKWNEAMKPAIIDSQRKDGERCMYKGSWDNIDPWGPDGGRVYSTAMMALCLEVYYRYERVSGK